MKNSILETHYESSCRRICFSILPVMAMLLLGCQEELPKPTPPNSAGDPIRPNVPATGNISPRAFDIELQTVDDDTGEAILLEIRGFPMSLRETDGEIWWDEIEILSGNATRITGRLSSPVRFQVSSEGYESREVEITPGQKGDIAIRLRAESDAGHKR